jgi:cytochrome oxidase Cu insertion factor (SCO1/SenC/PrrC family)
MSTDPTPEAPRRINPLTLWVPIIFIVLGVVVFYNYLIYTSMEAKKNKETQTDAQGTTRSNERPAYLGRLEKDLELVERSGKTVHLADLRGKIIIASWVFTRCPRGCAGVIAKLKKLYAELGDNPNVQFISFTLDPEDTPEMMKAWATGVGIKDTDHWWFLNGPKDDVRKYMTFSFQFRPVQDLPVEDRLTPDDKYIHDLRVALVDHAGHVRGLHDIMNADPQFQEYWDKQIRTDLNYLLEEQKKAQDKTP